MTARFQWVAEKMDKRPPQFTRSRNMRSGERYKLYFLQCGEFLKIGIAGDVQKRLQAIQTGSPVPVFIAAELDVPRSLAFQIEQKVHAELDGLRASGEWFRVELDDALALARAIAEPAEAVDAEWALADYAREEWARKLIAKHGMPKFYPTDDDAMRRQRIAMLALE